MNADQRLEARETRRIKSDDRYHDRISAREEAADRMVGELNGGKCYVYPVGGRYREGQRHELVAFLVRNRYV